MSERTHFVTVFRTGNLVYFDWACGALDDAGIPNQRREETSGGLQTAMPVAPAVFPGVWWALLVPESSAAKACEILDALPFERKTTPDVWDFGPKPMFGSAWKVGAAIAVWIIVAGLIKGMLMAQ